jgi:type II secretory pathway pseudopilin PulG
MAAPALLYRAMPSRSPCTRGTRGRSLVEVLTAIGISSILLATAVPNLQGMRAPWVLRQTAGQVAAEFEKARMRAIARGTRYRFSYNATNKTYTIDREFPAGTWTVENTGQLPTSASITAPATTPIFDTRGMLNATATIPVSVTNYSHTRTVTINVLGNVTIS